MCLVYLVSFSILLTVRTPEMASFGFSPAWLGVAKAKQICLSTRQHRTNQLKICPKFSKYVSIRVNPGNLEILGI